MCDVLNDTGKLSINLSAAKYVSLLRQIETSSMVLTSILGIFMILTFVFYIRTILQISYFPMVSMFVFSTTFLHVVVHGVDQIR